MKKLQEIASQKEINYLLEHELINQEYLQMEGEVLIEKGVSKITYSDGLIVEIYDSVEPIAYWS